MAGSTTESLRQLYEELPYPNVPIEASGRSAIGSLYRLSWTTAQYARTRAILPSEGIAILNVGCGSGWETLILAEANPGARLVACDLSPASVQATERRLRYHGFGRWSCMPSTCWRLNNWGSSLTSSASTTCSICLRIPWRA